MTTVTFVDFHLALFQISELLKCANISAPKLVPLDTESRPSPSGSLATLKIISGFYFALYTKSRTKMETTIGHLIRRLKQSWENRQRIYTKVFKSQKMRERMAEMIITLRLIHSVALTFSTCEIFFLSSCSLSLKPGEKSQWWCNTFSVETRAGRRRRTGHHRFETMKYLPPRISKVKMDSVSIAAGRHLISLWARGSLRSPYPDTMNQTFTQSDS